MLYSDTVLFDTILTLDRASRDKDISPTSALAATLLSMKLTYDRSALEQLHNRAVGFEEHLTHLGRNSVEFKDIINAEIELLADLHGVHGIPTARTFLNALGRNIHAAAGCRPLAEFLLQLSLGCVDVCYGDSHVALAVAAWMVAMYSTRAPLGVCAGVLEKLAACFSDMSEARQEVHRCVCALVRLWDTARSDAEEGRQSFLTHVYAKFARDCCGGVSKFKLPTMCWLHAWLDKQFVAISVRCSGIERSEDGVEVLES